MFPSPMLDAIFVLNHLTARATVWHAMPASLRLRQTLGLKLLLCLGLGLGLGLLLCLGLGLGLGQS